MLLNACSCQKILRRFLGFVNCKFLPNMTNKITPLCNLTKKDKPFVWSSVQEENVMKLVTAAPVLALYDPSKELVLDQY